MRWQEAMCQSDIGVIQHETGTIMSGPTLTIAGYDLDIESKLILQDVPEQRVQLVLEEFDISDGGWSRYSESEAR